MLSSISLPVTGSILLLTRVVVPISKHRCGPTVAVRVQQAPLGLARPGCVSIDKGTSGILISNCNVRVTTMASYEATDRHNPIRMGPNMDGPGRASSRLASGSSTSSCEGGALPVSVSITGPREPHDYRVCNPIRLSRSTGCFTVVDICERALSSSSSGVLLLNKNLTDRANACDQSSNPEVRGLFLAWCLGLGGGTCV